VLVVGEPRVTRAVVLLAALSAVCGGAALGCRATKNELVATANASAASGAPAAVKVEAPRADGGPAGTVACAPVDRAKIAPFAVDQSLVTAAVPSIVDKAGALTSFYDRVLTLARQTPTTSAKDHVRIAVYGDSNLTSDHLTGHLRRALQARFGDAGHGYVALAMPWAWYTHEDVHHHGTWSMFKQVDCTTDPVPGHRYGFANLAAESNTAGAPAWVRTADGTSPIGRTANRFEVYFLKQPGGGSFDIELDGVAQRTIRTAASDFEAGFETVETTDAAHELRCVVKGDGMVRLYGTTLERQRESEPRSVVVDSLGTGAMNFQRFLLTEPLIRRAQLTHRKYDLVVVWLGTNVMWLGPNRAWVKDTIATFRAATPGVPVLIMTPPDSVKAGEKKSDPRILDVVRQLREAAEESGAAFWDLHAAQGGNASFLFFMSHRLASPDRAHLLREGSELMAARFLAALFEGVQARLESKPEAGCDPSI
jgi:hypothetical protein